MNDIDRGVVGALIDISLRQQALDRFVAKIDHGDPGNPDACDIWTGGWDQNGYGQFWFRGRAYGAHRFGWEVANAQSLQPGQRVTHTCEFYACVRGSHLLIK